MYYNTPELFSYSRYWAECYGQADVLPMSRAEMDTLGWDSCDIILVTGDAYIDHPSFGMAVVGRVLEAQGYRVGIIAQPDWRDSAAFSVLGKPNLFFGVAAGNMDSMINRYTADRLPRSDDAYSPDGRPGLRPDRSTIVYTQRCREAFPDAPIVIGGIEASLRRLAHYDYWEDDIRRSILFDCAADLLVYGNAERQIVEIAQRFARGQSASSMHDLRGVAFLCQRVPNDWQEIDETKPEGTIEFIPPDPYAAEPACPTGSPVVVTPEEQVLALRPAAYYENTKCVIRLPSFEQVKGDKLLYAHTSRMFHKETNPLNARAVVQRHGNRELWVNPPSLPLSTDEMDWVFGLHYSRLPHPRYGKAKFPAYEMIRFSINIMRGCFGGCTFCSITEHEGRIIQSRSEESIINEIETIRDTVPGFTGVISDLGGPTANMWRMACKTREIESSCRKLSCVFPGICKNLQTDHTPLIKLYRRARNLPGVKKILIASGLRYDLAVESPEYVRELVMHHVGGYLKIAPEHTENAPLSMMMKPGIGSYDKFKAMFEQYTREAGKEQYLIPYFIAGHPGTSDEDMMSLAVWLKTNNFRADQVQTFIPSPMAIASAMYHTGFNPLKPVRRDKDRMYVPRALGQRRLQKAFLRYHDPDNWPTLRKALHKLGRADMIGNGPSYLIPATQPVKVDTRVPGAEKHNRQTAHRLLTQHTGLPPAPAFEPRRAKGKTKPPKGTGRKS